MKYKKSKMLIIVSLILTAAIFSSCNTKKSKNSKNNKLKVVCTIFPEYDWTKSIIGNSEDYIDLSLIVKNGVDLHSFQPSTADILEITTADIFIYVGGISDNWVTDVLKTSNNKNMKVINLMEVLGDRVKVKEVIEGMEVHHHEEETSDDEIKFNHSHNEPVYDEHIWLSLKNARLCCIEIAEALCNALPSKASYFNKNLINYLAELKALDDDFSQAVSNAREKTIIVCDRFPFRYLVEDYNLNYYAAFSGCSAETEASFETIAFLSHKLQETKLGSVITIDNSDNKIANTVIQNSANPECKIVKLDSMQSTTLEDALAGKTYIKTMADNFNSLKTALK